MMDNKTWYSLSTDETLRALNTSVGGLSSDEAGQRLEQYGPNELSAEKRETALGIFLRQFKNFLILILALAAIASGAIGIVHGSAEDVIEAVAIAVVIVFIAVIGFVQEYKAGKELAALKKMITPISLVIRDGEKIQADAKNLVPGDIIVLEAGDKVPADARIVKSTELRVDEATLTGESTPVGKSIETLDEKTVLGDRKNMVYMGTTVTYGKAEAVVVATAMSTQFGKIAQSIQTIEQEKTPLQIKLDHIGKQIGAVVIFLSVIMFVVGLIANVGTPITMFLAAVALAVAAVPEGLPAVVTVTLARGMRLMVKKNAIARTLTAVETLGSTTVICSDKTGTLTRNEMTVKKIYINNRVVDVTGVGYTPEGEFTQDGRTYEMDATLETLLKGSILCNDATLSEFEEGYSITGDPTEASLVVLAAKGGYDQQTIQKEIPRVGEIVFSSQRKRMTTVHETPGGQRIAYVKGAADVILPLCTRVLVDGAEIKLSDKAKAAILKQNDEFAVNALRVLGLAYKNVGKSDKIDESMEEELVFIGLTGMIDPPRQDATAAIKECKAAGIKTIMITGDHKLTAQAIAKEMGILEDGGILTGAELDEKTDEELEQLIETTTVYARVSPEHKLRIVKALKRKDHVTAMTGDGVNDAPALKKADIGIAMGITGTDVTREAADIVLTDDNFTSIVSAVEEGRGIFDNIKLFIKYLLSCNIGEVITIFVGIVVFAKLVLEPLQILWMNLLTDVAPALALGFNPVDPDVMSRKPRDPKEKIINKRTIYKFLGIGILMSAGTLAMFVYTMNVDPSKAQSVAFTTLVLFQMFYVLSCRSDKFTFLKSGLFSNRYLLPAVIFSVLMQVAVLNIPIFQEVFKTVALSWEDWIRLTAVASTAFIIPEILKLKR